MSNRDFHRLKCIFILASKPFIFAKLCFMLRANLIFTNGTTDSVFASTDAVAFPYSHFGASSGTRTVYLDEVQCTGSETNLTDCPRSSMVSCHSYYSYAGVRCQGVKKLYNAISAELFFKQNIEESSVCTNFIQ